MNSKEKKRTLNKIARLVRTLLRKTKSAPSDIIVRAECPYKSTDFYDQIYVDVTRKCAVGHTCEIIRAQIKTSILNHSKEAAWDFMVKAVALDAITAIIHRFIAVGWNKVFTIYNKVDGK